MLNFQDISQYLPYGLLVQYECRKYTAMALFIYSPPDESEVGLIIYEDDLPEKSAVKISQIKPFFRPLSQLVQEIEHDGQKFVPIVELAKIACLGFERKLPIEIFRNGFAYTVAYDNSHFTFEPTIFLGFINSNLQIPKNQKALFDKMVSWHFWLGDQSYFEKGIILPINV